MASVLRSLVYAGLFLAVGCLPAAAPGGFPPAPGSGDGSPAVGSQKTITVSSLTPITAFGAWDTSNAGGTFAVHGVHTSALITTDLQGNPTGQLLSRLPSLEDGTIAILPDGRMQTRWNLRPNVVWHDGMPVTADDLAFTLRVYQHPSVGVQTSAITNNMERIDVVDATNAVVTWKTTYYQPLRLGLREFWPVPRHLLGAPFDANASTFSNLPYWTTEYVNTGPFRLVDYGLGENVVFERFDNYFLGRPKVDRIVLRVIGDANVVLANLRAGAIDMSSDGTLPGDLALALHAEWSRTGEGSVVSWPGSFRFEVVQLDPQWARPPELSRDVRIRRGLLMGLDRKALAEALLPGVPDAFANSFLPESDPRTPIVGRPFERYSYNPAAAAQQLADAGWHRAVDGRLLNQAGEQLEVQIRSQPAHSKEAAIIAQYWRELGLRVEESVVASSLARDSEYNATFPGFSGHANGSREGWFARLVSTAHATPQNRWSGANTGHYSNLRLDELTAMVYATPDRDRVLPMLKELGEILATDLPALPSYFGVSMAAVRKEVRALVNEGGFDSPSELSKNAHQWDRV